MTLPNSGSFKASQINTELGRSSGTLLKASSSEMRSLAGIASGTYKASNLYGKSSFSVVFSDKSIFRTLPSNGYVYLTMTPQILGGVAPISVSFTETGVLSIHSQTSTSVTLKFLCAGIGDAESIVYATAKDSAGKTIIAEARARISYEVVYEGQNPR